MAVTTDGWFSNSLPMAIPQGGDFNIFDKHSTPRYAVGTRVKRADGAEFVYSHFGANVNRGVIVAADVSESGVVDTDNGIISPASAVTTSDGTIGSRFIQLTLASVTADQFAGGYFITTDDTGEGYTYRIKGNTATDNPATGDIRVELYEKLQVAVDNTTDFAIHPCQYANLEIATAATDLALAGVTCSTMVVATAAYGWVCTKHSGLGVLQDDAIAIGDNVCISDSINGAVKKCDSVSDEQIVGTCVIAGDSTGHGVFKIDIS